MGLEHGSSGSTRENKLTQEIQPTAHLEVVFPLLLIENMLPCSLAFREISSYILLAYQVILLDFGCFLLIHILTSWKDDSV